jgi:hypothetical protein
MIELSGDFEFRFHLLDETVILFIMAQNVFEGVNLPRPGIADGVDDATRTFSQTLQHLILEELLSHALSSTPGNVISHACWMAGRVRRQPKVGNNKGL